MEGFYEGYEFFLKHSSYFVASYHSDEYVQTIVNEINSLVNDLNGFNGFATSIGALKGDVAEFWHAGTFNVDAALKHSKSRAWVNRSNDFASVDISTNFGKSIGLKYYGDGIASAKAQSVSIFQRFKEYKSQGGKDSIEDFLLKRGYKNTEDILNDPIYSGQVRIIPSDQLEEAIDWLTKKIEKEKLIRPDQVKRYEETLNLLRASVSDGKGANSKYLTKEGAEKLAQLAKKGKIDAEKLGLEINELMQFEYIVQESLKAGLNAALVTAVLKSAPEIYKALSYLIINGVVDAEQLKKTGMAALSGAAEGFVRGSVAAAITTSFKSGLCGEACKSVSPSIISSAVVLVMDTMKNSYKVARGEMTTLEMTSEMVKNLYVSTCSLIAGGISQTIIEVPIVGYLLGSFAGSMFGALSYEYGYSKMISFCVDTGFTLFGLVDQDYSLPESVLKQIGLEVFEYEKFEYEKFEYEKFEYEKFEYEKFEYEQIELVMLKRGLIGINKVSYLC